MSKYRIATKFLQNNAGKICEAARIGHHTFLIMRHKDIVAQLVEAESYDEPTNIPEIKTVTELNKIISQSIGNSRR